MTTPRRKWSDKRFRTAFDELVAESFVEYDYEHRIVLLPGALKRNKLNENQRKNVVKALRELSPTPLRKRFATLTQSLAPELCQMLQQELPEVFP